MTHPYKKTCDKYQASEYDKFLNDFHKNFYIKLITGTNSINKPGFLTGYYEPVN